MAGSSNKRLSCKVLILDDTEQSHEIQRKALGLDLHTMVYSNLQMIETDYFGLQFFTEDNTEWLDKEKTILSQCKASNLNEKEIVFCLRVKFYTPEPTLLEHDLTRYLFAQQIKNDLVCGRLQCNENTSAILASYIVQSVIGDFYYQANDHHSYLKSLKLVPNQSDEIEDKIAEYHKALRGLSVVEAEFQLLDVARKTEKYGVVSHACENSEGVAIQLAVTHTGIHSFMNGVRSYSYIWVKIRKLGFKRRRFLIKLFPPAEKPKSVNAVEFTFSTRDAAKSFWKLVVEHHSFFRKLEVKPPRRRVRHPLRSSGSSFRYSGRTQTQLVEQMKEKWGQSTFDRSMSLRNFPSTTANKFGTTRSATFNNRQDLSTMTLDRRGMLVHAPTTSQVTLESRYSGSYDTTEQQHTDNTHPMSVSVSHSLSAMSSLNKSNGKFDLKSSRTFLTNKDGDRDSHRDSIAIVEDNRQELERLVEQINSDLTSAQRKQQDLEAGSPTVNTDTSSAIELFLSSQPKSTAHSQPSKLKVTAETIAGTPVRSYTQADNDDEQLQPVDMSACAVSDDETLEILLTEDIKDVPVTDLDSDSPPKIPQKMAHRLSESSNQTHEHTHQTKDSKTSTPDDRSQTEAHDVTVNDVLDKAGAGVDDTLVLSIDENNLSSYSKSSTQKHPVEIAGGATSADVIILSSPDSGDEDVVFRSALDFSISSSRPSVPPGVRRGRVRSRQEEMDDLTGISELAEQVLSSEIDPVYPVPSQRSQEISDLATQVLDFCDEITDKPKQDQLSDLSELLAHYDTIKQQQKRINQFTAGQRQTSTQSELAANNADKLSNSAAIKPKELTKTQTPDVRPVDVSAVLMRPAKDKPKRKPLIRPALPVLSAPRERLLDPPHAESTDSLKSDWMSTDKGAKYGLKVSEESRMVDSGIELYLPPGSSGKLHPSTNPDCATSSKVAKSKRSNFALTRTNECDVSDLTDQSQVLSSDGYSSDSDVATCHDTSSQVICNPMVEV